MSFTQLQQKEARGSLPSEDTKIIEHPIIEELKYPCHKLKSQFSLAGETGFFILHRLITKTNLHNTAIVCKK